MPGVVAALSLVAPLLLLVGALTFLGTTSRGFFDGAPFQASLGLVLVLTGVMFVVAAAVIAAVRSIAKQHVEIMLAVERARVERGR